MVGTICINAGHTAGLSHALSSQFKMKQARAGVFHTVSKQNMGAAASWGAKRVARARCRILRSLPSSDHAKVCSQIWSTGWTRPGLCGCVDRGSLAQYPHTSGDNAGTCNETTCNLTMYAKQPPIEMTERQICSTDAMIRSSFNALKHYDLSAADNVLEIFCIFS